MRRAVVWNTRRLGSRWTAWLVLVLGLAACGGGEGGDGPGPRDGGWSDTRDIAVPDDPTDPGFAPDSAGGDDLARDVAGASDVEADTEPPPGGVLPVFDPDGADLFSLPFPTDALRTEDGRLDLSRFPNPDAVPMVENLLSVAMSVLDGWSVVPVVYFVFEDSLDEKSLPKTYIPAEADAPVQWVDVTPGASYGQRVPLLWRYREDPGLYLPARTLMVRPVWGFTLAEGHTYAVLATSGLRGADGRPVARPPAFQKALDGTLPGHEALVVSLRPLRDLLAAEPDLAGTVAVGTVLTVGHPTADLRRIRDYLYDETEPPVITDIRNATGVQDVAFYRYEGHYVAPNFLKGTPPYLEDGYFEFDQSGKPVVQFLEKMRFVLIVPKGRDMPPSGWPIVIHSHGTGGKYDSHVKNPGIPLAQEGLAGIGIDQPLHGDRVSPPLSQEELELYSFNFLNVRAGRTVQRQSVPDNVSLLRMIRAGNLRVPADVSGAGREERFDADAVLFFGHSQGGLTGGMLFGVEDRFRGGVLSGAGGGLSLTLMLRKDYVDIADMLRGFLNIADPTELTEDHPVVQLMQMLVDASDPIAYAPFYFNDDGSDQSSWPRAVLATEGMHDEQTPPATTEAMAATAGLPVLAPFSSWPLGLTLKGIGPASLPVSGNIALPDGERTTGLLIQFEDGDHFTVFDDFVARSYYREFLRTLATEPQARVGAD